MEHKRPANQTLPGVLLAGALCFSCALPGWANPMTPGASDIDFGYMCAVEATGWVEAEDTISGVVNLVEGDPVFTARTTDIPAMIGVEFGVFVQVTPEFEGVSTVHVDHPPQGEYGIIHETWEQEFWSDEQTYVGFVFEYDYELTPGEWIMSARRDGTLVYEVRFNVVSPDELPVALLDCGASPHMS